MAGYKGVGIVFIRRLVRERGDDVERQVLAALNEAERTLYAVTPATAWVPIEFVTHLAMVAAPLLYPDDPAPLDRLGRALAVDNMGGIYAFLVRVMTVEFIARQSARLWSTYHQQGEARTVDVGPHEVRFEVRGYQDIPRDFRRYARTFIQQLVEMTGAKGVDCVSFDAADHWGYRITFASR
ncbi:MAG TPA: hypothetical protein VGF99_05310 [Myxococcota bacterium]